MFARNTPLCGIVLAADLVVPVAVRALRRDEKAALLERLAVDAVVVLGEDVADRDAAVLDDLRVAVARPAQCWGDSADTSARLGSPLDRMSCLPWQSVHVAALDVPVLARLGVNAPCRRPRRGRRDRTSSRRARASRRAGSSALREIGVAIGAGHRAREPNRRTPWPATAIERPSDAVSVASSWQARQSSLPGDAAWAAAASASDARSDGPVFLALMGRGS